MSTIPTIESRNLSIAAVFQDFYTVPDFQREYVWKDDNVKKLLEDLFEGLGLYEGEYNSNSSEYFLGSIVVCPDNTDDKKTFQLIDGQQRLTTIYLIFCALRYFIKKLGDESRATEDLIKGCAQDINTGEDIDKYRLSLQYDSLGKKLLNCILDGEKYDQSLLKASQSAKNIDKAWKIIRNFLYENLEENPKRFKEVCSAIANRTKLIRIESPNLKNALKVFETINERGIGLTPVDLLKNYLFIHTANGNDQSRDWQNITRKWGELLKILYQSQQEPLSFLRYYLMSHYKEVDLSNGFPEEEIYDWFLKKGEKYDIKKQPITFLENLIAAADHYCKFTQGKNTDGSDNIHLQNISRIQGRAKQHLILLLSGRLLHIELFNKLSYYVENLVFVHAITRKTRGTDYNLTREYAQWSRELINVETREELDIFIEQHIIPKLELWKENFKQSLLQISGSMAKYRLRYILAKIAQFVEQKAYGHAKNIKWYFDKNITIEHILSKSSKNSQSQKFGNLTLLEKTINSSVSDKSYTDKILGYRQSQILITRCLAEIPYVGTDTQLNRAMRELGLVNFAEWGANCIEQRQNILVNIAMQVWGIDV